MVAWPLEVLQRILDCIYLLLFVSFSVSSCLAATFSIPSHPDFSEPSDHCFCVCFSIPHITFFFSIYSLLCFLPEGTPSYISREDFDSQWGFLILMLGSLCRAFQTAQARQLGVDVIVDMYSWFFKLHKHTRHHPYACASVSIPLFRWWTFQRLQLRYLLCARKAQPTQRQAFKGPSHSGFSEVFLKCIGCRSRRNCFKRGTFAILYLPSSSSCYGDFICGLWFN